MYTYAVECKLAKRLVISDSEQTIQLDYRTGVGKVEGATRAAVSGKKGRLGCRHVGRE